jgi:hypothetical protein
MAARSEPALRLGEVHGAAPLARHQLFEVGGFQFVAGGEQDGLGFAGIELGHHGEGGIGREPHFPDRRRHALGQALAAVVRRKPEPHPAAFGKLLVSFGPARRRDHLAVFEAAALAIADGIERCQHAGGKLSGFFQHGIDQVRRGLFATGQARNLGQAGDFVEQEADVGQRGVVVGHRFTFPPALAPCEGVAGVRRCAAPCRGWRTCGRPCGVRPGVGAGATAIYFGAMRSAPSRRMVSPLSISFSTMCAASCAYSSGRPRRGGKGTDLASESCTSAGSDSIIGV